MEHKHEVFASRRKQSFLAANQRFASYDFRCAQTQSMQKSKIFDSVLGNGLYNTGRCISEI
ncbi:MAG: hypothetical protein ACXVHS_10095 [Methanobacterium sp.]